MEFVSEDHQHTECRSLPPQTTSSTVPRPLTDPPHQGLPSDHPARPALARALSTLRSDRLVDEEALVRLAWEHFLAGFAAGASTASAAETGPSPSVSPSTTNHSDADIPGPTEAPSPTLAERVAHLTPRRLEVLRLVARGLTNREIGEVLGISGYTVKSHLASLFEALDVTNRTEAAFALQQHESAT